MSKYGGLLEDLDLYENGKRGGVGTLCGDSAAAIRSLLAERDALKALLVRARPVVMDNLIRYDRQRTAALLADIEEALI